MSYSEISFSCVSGWFISIPVTFVLSSLIFRSLKFNYKETILRGNPCHILAFLLVCTTMNLYLSLASIYSFIYGITDPIQDNRFFGTSLYVAEYLLIPMIALQFWDFLLCFVQTDLYSYEMMIHHFVMGLVCLICFVPLPILHYYVPFFFIVEITNVPLTILDVFKYFPNLKDQYKQVYNSTKIIFAISFFFFRICMLTHTNYNYWTDFIYVFKLGLVPNFIIFVTHLASNAIATGLNYFWGYKIFKIFIATLTGGKNNKIK